MEAGVESEILNNLLAWAAHDEEQARAQLERISRGEEVTRTLVNGKMVDTSIQTAQALKKKLADLNEILKKQPVQFQKPAV
jgi:CTP-dependent riboflavin kinase